MQLEQIIERIEDAFGEALPFSSSPLSARDQAVLRRVFSDAGYQTYMQDQHNRQIIRDYLTNAVMLKVISEEQLAAFSVHVATEEGRAALSLHMLMSSVEEAGGLAANSSPDHLEPLKPGPESPPHMQLVPSS